MKLEFLPAGSPACPLVRIFDFSATEAQSLRRLCFDLFEERVAAVSLADLPGIIALGGCSVTLRASDINRGGELVAPNAIECSLTPDSWHDVADFITPFCEAEKPSGYQWLSEHGEIALLLSSNGQW